jgi:GT2 family glycosyltransferase
VIVPLYNKVATVARALTSIVNQTFSDIEIIVVDDGSTDASAQIAAGFADARLRVIRQENRGPGAARNRGIAESSSDLIAFLDADDEWLPEFLEHSVAALERAGPDVAAVVCGYVEGAQGTSTEQYWRARGLCAGPLRLTATTPATYVVTVLAYMNPWATVVRRNVLLRYGGFYEHGCRYGEDNYLWLKLVLNEGIFIALEPLVCWHNEASDLSRNLAGPRPVEPFLRDSSALYDACPPSMKPLLHDVLAIRAGKTASVLSFWGKWQEGSRLVDTFTTLRDLRYSWVRIGRLSSTPFGAAAGFALRKSVPFVRGLAQRLRFARSR